MACLLRRSSTYLGSATESGRGLLGLHTFLAEAKICQDHVSLWVRDNRKGLGVQVQMPHLRETAVRYGEATQAACLL